MLSADTGAGKSFVSSSIALAIIQGKPWCGNTTTGQRVMFIDEENSLRIVHGRLKALGMRNEDRPYLRYFLRLGVLLGDGDWFERVDDEMEDFKPDLLVIDTVAAATAVEVNNNDAVSRFYSSVLRPLAETCAVLILHHEKKPQQGQRDASQAMMGARQWAGQADAHFALSKAGKITSESTSEGLVLRRYPLEIENPKDRDGWSQKGKIVIVSEHEPDERAARWTRVERVGR